MAGCKRGLIEENSLEHSKRHCGSKTLARWLVDADGMNVVMQLLDALLALINVCGGKKAALIQSGKHLGSSCKMGI